MRGPIIENDHLWVCTKFTCLHIPGDWHNIQKNSWSPPKAQVSHVCYKNRIDLSFYSTLYIKP